jgi:hypothetical protein
MRKCHSYDIHDLYPLIPAPFSILVMLCITLVSYYPHFLRVSGFIFHIVGTPLYPQRCTCLTRLTKIGASPAVVVLI